MASKKNTYINLHLHNLYPFNPLSSTATTLNFFKSQLLGRSLFQCQDFSGYGYTQIRQRLSNRFRTKGMIMKAPKKNKFLENNTLCSWVVCLPKSTVQDWCRHNCFSSMDNIKEPPLANDYISSWWENPKMFNYVYTINHMHYIIIRI